MRITVAAALLAAFVSTAAVAQQPEAATPPASAPFVPRVDAESNPGWDMMTAKERADYRQRMLAAPTRDECRRMRDQQIKQAAQRANVRGIKDLPNPRYDACE